MLAALTTFDLGILGLYLAGLVATAVCFSARQRTGAEFLVGSRQLPRFPLAMSIGAMAAGIAYLQLPAEAYERGLVCLVVPMAFWLTLPVALFLVIPLYRGLGLVSVYEYLELRFDRRVRRLAAAQFVLAKLLAAAAVLALFASLVERVTGRQVPEWWLIGGIGLAATLVNFLGGVRATVWGGLLHAGLMLAGIALVVAAVWTDLDDGPHRVREIATGLRRGQLAELDFHWADSWALGALLPFWVLTTLALVVADQGVGQRLLAGQSVNAARTSYLWATLLLTALLPGLVYGGLCVLAFYNDRPEALRPAWVVNLEGTTRQTIADAEGRPLLNPENPAHDVNSLTVDQLVAENRILQPNNKEPFAASSELFDEETGRLLVERLAMRRPPVGKLNGEWIVAQDAPQEMWLALVFDQLSWGIAGLSTAGLLAAVLAVLDSGLGSIVSVVSVDLLGAGAMARSSPPSPPPQDELQVARPLTLAAGGLIVLVAWAISFLETASALLVLAGVLVGPVLALFLLGMLTRTATATAVLWAQAIGTAGSLGGLAVAWFAASQGGATQPGLVADVWPMIGGTVLAAAAGWILSLMVGRRKAATQLRGLVAGCGTLGLLAIEEAVPMISLPPEDDSIRWK